MSKSFEFFTKPTWEQFQTIAVQNEQMFYDYINSPGYGIPKSLYAPIGKIFPDVIDSIIGNLTPLQLSTCEELLIHIKENNRKLFDELCDSFPNLEKDLKIWSDIRNRYVDDIDRYVEKNLPEMSSRKRSGFAQIYPELYAKPVDKKDNYKRSKALIALEVCNKNYIEDNIGYYLSNLKKEFIDLYPKAFDYLYPNEYTDEDLLKHINESDNIKYSKSDNTALEFIKHHKKILPYTVSNIDMIRKLREINISPSSINYDLINKYPSEIIQAFPQYYETIIEEIGEERTLYELSADDHLKALDDPYNIVWMVDLHLISDITFNKFMINSNIELYESKLALDHLKGVLHPDFFKNLIEDFVKTMNSEFSAVYSFPVLAFYLDDGAYMTPYIINHLIKIENRILEFM